MTGANILIVEDECLVSLDIKRTLERLGYRVLAVVTSGEAAIERTAETQPDLVLMDIKLKGATDGVEAAERIRARFDTPVVYLTALADDATLQRTKVTEPFGYILKPFEDIELRTTIEMALHKHEKERKLRQSERWLATVLEGIGDAVIASDKRGCVKFMNPVAEGLTDWKHDEAWGEDFEEVFHIIHEETRVRAECPVARVLREGTVVGLGDHILLVTKGGDEIPIDDSAAPIRDGEGTVAGVVVVFRDISDRVRADQTLRGYTLELQARNEDLNAYVSTVAHDLKAPLHPIIGFAELLETEYTTLPDRDLQEYLHLIAQTGRKMSNIIEELLLLAEVRTEEITLSPLAMGSIVAEAQRRLDYLIDEFQVGITSPDTWPPALGRGLWIEEVWVNYLSNGIKYGGQPPRLELGAAIQADGMVRFWVHDNGRGLTPEEQARLFTPFTQLSQVRATGHGLGLSIVRRIVEKLGGHVGVESEVGQGSVFSFTLPQAAVMMPGEEAQTPT
jgi:PAS domain S-box-containing protein